MLKDNDTCKTLCVVPDVTKDEAKFINNRIREDYAMNWLIDGLPAAEMKYENKTGELFFDIGFNLGDNEGQYQNQPALNNHYEIVLRYYFVLCDFKTTANIHASTQGTTNLHRILIA